MEKKTRQSLGLITFGVILYVALMNLNYVYQFFRGIVDIFLPIVIGGVLAFVLSVPMNGFAKGIRKISLKRKRKLKEKYVQAVSLLLTIFSILLVIILVYLIVVPQIVLSVKGIALMIKENWPHWAEFLSAHNIDTVPIVKWLENLELEQVFVDLASNAGNLLDKLAGTAVSTVSVLINCLLALVVMFYLLLSKNELARQGKKLLYANLNEEMAKKILYVLALIRNTYARFLSGQCIESMILGVLMLLAFSICRLPYAGLIAMLTSVCAFIPYVGAFLSCSTGVLLTLLSNPAQAIFCLIVYQVVQFMENQFIYPRVVGNSMGIPPLWTFIAALVGGKMFGLAGILFFIPLTAVIYTLVRENTVHKLAEKKISFE